MSEIEKHFFEAFGIEPKTNEVYGMQLGYHIKEYPQITDRILLELAALCRLKTYDEYKNECLIKIIKIMGKNVYKISQVQALFKDNSNDN